MKNKNKKILYLFKVLSSKHLKLVSFSLLLFIIIAGLLIAMDRFKESIPDTMFGVNLKTNLVQKSQIKIDNLVKQIDIRKKCTEDQYWLPRPEDVCNYWLYKQKNDYCKRFGVPNERFSIGKKICCTKFDDHDIYFEGKQQNVEACPGTDIFFDEKRLHESKLVALKEQCGPGACLFYPKNGFHVKIDEQENYVLEKDCPEKVISRGRCSAVCGGGTRTVTKKTKFCTEGSFDEPCNTRACGVGWSEAD